MPYYKIALRIYQRDTKAFFRVVEQTVWNFGNGGTWSGSDSNSIQTLTMPRSGTSGTLRFHCESTNEAFLVAVGVDDNEPWCDVITDLKGDQTGTSLHPEYYTSLAKVNQRKEHVTSYAVASARNRSVEATFTVENGYNLEANIVIG